MVPTEGFAAVGLMNIGPNDEALRVAVMLWGLVRTIVQVAERPPDLRGVFTVISLLAARADRLILAPLLDLPLTVNCGCTTIRCDMVFLAKKTKSAIAQ